MSCRLTMATTAAVTIGLLLFVALTNSRADPQQLPNGKLLVASTTAASEVGSFPVNAIAMYGGKYAVISDMGLRQKLTCIETATGRIVGSIDFTSGAQDDKTNGLYYGLACSGNIVYAAQGAASSIAIVQVASNGTLNQLGTINGVQGEFTSGIAIDSRGYLYSVENEFDDTLHPANIHNTIDPGSLVVFSLGLNSRVLHVPLLSTEVRAAKVSFSPTNFPLAICALSDGSRVFIGSQRDGTVCVVNTSDTPHSKVIASIKTGSHPDALLLSTDQKRLFVANADSDTISVIDTHTLKVVRTINVRPAAANGFPGATPTGLALSPDQSTLYVALGDMNAVAVVRASGGKVLGYIPTGWYPTSVIATSNRLLITSAKGNRTRNPNDVKQGPKGAWGTYILNILEGTAVSIALPDKARLVEDTREVIAANRFAEISAKHNAALASLGIGSGKITHVIYIIKENRTYDQVLGDLPEGNGDKKLTLFGGAVTPNLHALAERFVLLDNFFDCGDVSGDGWAWSTQSYANEAVAKNVPYNYSGRGRQYDYEGQNNGYPTAGFPAIGPYGNQLSLAFPAGAPPLPDVSESPSGHIWDVARSAGVTYRNYGFFLTTGMGDVIPDNYPDAIGLLPAGHDLSGASDIDFRRFDLDYPDSNAASIYFNKDHDKADLYETTKYGHYDAPSRYAEWQREFDEMIAADQTGAKVPALMTVRFMMDHTSAASSGKHTPRSDVADNDFAVGELVEHVSRSPIWKHTAIFVVEDDAQDGQDHVDAHRSDCFVISPYIKEHTLDHTFYNTDSVLHSIELLLGIRPMSQYDAIATPILDFGFEPTNSTQYQSILPAESIIAEHNPSAAKMGLNDPRRPLALASDRMDFVHPDSAPADQTNAIVWKTVRGARSNPPAPVHSVFRESSVDPISALSGTPADDEP